MVISTDAFFDHFEATRILVTNLETNLEMLGGRLTPEERRALMRTNLIVIRSCLEDFGAFVDENKEG